MPAAISTRRTSRSLALPATSRAWLQVVGHDPTVLAQLGGLGVHLLHEWVILTNLHVVAGAKHVTVRFFDGSESAVDLVRAFPENDLAVIKAKKVPKFTAGKGLKDAVK